MAYITKTGDTWDVIAKNVYGDEYKAGFLMENNPDHIGTFIFSAGEELSTPAITSSVDKGSVPPWKAVQK